MSHARTAILVLAAWWASSAACAAAALDECPARTYKPCASFTTSRTIDEHTPLIDAATGLTRSKGQLDHPRELRAARRSARRSPSPSMWDRSISIGTTKRVFRNGAGTISESGTFMHRTGDVESGLRIATTSCRVPDDESERVDDDEQERREWEAERERLEWQAERERLALEVEREREVQEAERQRLLEATQRKRREAERLRLAREADRKRREA